MKDVSARASEENALRRLTLGETEDVVDEEEHVLALLITEVLSNSETA